jgi:superfamily II DNA/RNA helicase
MTLDDLQQWILSVPGFKNPLFLLSRLAAAKSIGIERLDSNIATHNPDWPRLLFAASILANSESLKASETALMIAHAAILLSDNPQIIDGSAALLGQLANRRAIYLAERRSLLRPGVDERLGVLEKMLFARRELAHAIFVARGDTIQTNHFQRDLWNELERAKWVSASAPTASGKTYLVFRWLLNEFISQRTTLAVFLAPTRALVSEIERQIIDLARPLEISGLRVSSLPLATLGDLSKPTILVLTQERLHIFLNSLTIPYHIDTVIVDEVHKMGDPLRGVILQDGVERITRANPTARIAFLSPLTDNPEILLRDAPEGMATATVPSQVPTVTQNLVLAQQIAGRPKLWELVLKTADGEGHIGEFELHSRPDTQLKRLSYVSFALGRAQNGTLIYANRAADAEKIAWQIYDALTLESADGNPTDQELEELSRFASDSVHPEFQLVPLVKRGVAFHYGNMPTLLRSEIERLFRVGKIRFLVCTSTLIEGVNLACRTIVVRGPRKGNGNPMGAHDFWNLAGRAGRWGTDFHGNIICVDVHRRDLWPNGAPERARYPIRRETETVLEQRESMLQYIDNRLTIQIGEIPPQMEQVLAYLLAWKVREQDFISSPTATRLPREYAEQLNTRLTALMAAIEIPKEIISKHPGVSAVAMQSLLRYFRNREKPLDELLPSPPESDDAQSRLTAIFRRINRCMFPAFWPDSIASMCALITVAWMRGQPLGQIIRQRIAYMERHRRSFKIATLIRDTMKDVDEVARFKAPKYLSAYLDVLKIFLGERGQEQLLSQDLRFDLYLNLALRRKLCCRLLGLVFLVLVPLR